MDLFVLIPGSGLPGVPVSEGLCGSGSGHWSKSWKSSREPDAEHGDGPSGHSAVWTSGTDTNMLLIKLHLPNDACTVVSEV